MREISLAKEKEGKKNIKTGRGTEDVEVSGRAAENDPTK